MHPPLHPPLSSLIPFAAFSYSNCTIYSKWPKRPSSQPFLIFAKCKHKTTIWCFAYYMFIINGINQWVLVMFGTSTNLLVLLAVFCGNETSVKIVFVLVNIYIFCVNICHKNTLQFLLTPAHDQIESISISRHIYHPTVYHGRCGLFIPCNSVEKMAKLCTNIYNRNV